MIHPDWPVVGIVEPGPDRSNFRLRYRDSNGKQHWRSAKTAVRREAERAAIQWEEELRVAGGVVVGRMSWAAFRRRYESEALPALAAKTQKGYHTALNYIDNILCPKYTSNLTASSLSVMAAHWRKNGLAESSIKSYLKHVAAILSWGQGIGVIGHVPALPRVQRARRDTEPMKGRPITAAEFEAMLDATAGVVGERPASSWRRWLEGIWLSGLRLKESLILSWDNPICPRVDLTGKYPVFRFRRDAEKGNRDRYLPMVGGFRYLSGPCTGRPAFWSGVLPPRRCGSFRPRDMGNGPHRRPRLGRSGVQPHRQKSWRGGRRDAER